MKGNIEDEFRKTEREQQNSTRKSSSSISSTDALLPSRANCTKGYIRLEQVNKGRTTNNNFGNYGERISNYETEITRFRGRANFEIQKNKMENKIDSILSGIIAISNMVSNPQINNRPKRKIRRYRTLSKQAMKEYAMKQAYRILLNLKKFKKISYFS